MFHHTGSPDQWIGFSRQSHLENREFTRSLDTVAVSSQLDHFHVTKKVLILSSSNSKQTFPLRKFPPGISLSAPLRVPFTHNSASTVFAVVCDHRSPRPSHPSTHKLISASTFAQRPVSYLSSICPPRCPTFCLILDPPSSSWVRSPSMPSTR